LLVYGSLSPHLADTVQQQSLSGHEVLVGLIYRS
jgi:hypothetical protein